MNANLVKTMQNALRKVKEAETFNCDCPNGYTGKLCDIKNWLCEDGDKCQNGAKCMQRSGYSTCSCKPGFTGIEVTSYSLIQYVKSYISIFRIRAVTRALIVCVVGGGGGAVAYSYVHVLPD